MIKWWVSHNEVGGWLWNEGVIKRCFNWYSQSHQSTQVSKSVLFNRVDVVFRQLTVIKVRENQYKCYIIDLWSSHYFKAVCFIFSLFN